MTPGMVAVISPDVSVLRLAEALAEAGLAVREDAGRLVIRPAVAGRVRRVAPELSRLLNRLAVQRGGRRG